MILDNIDIILTNKEMDFLQVHFTKMNTLPCRACKNNESNAKRGKKGTNIGHLQVVVCVSHV